MRRFEIGVKNNGCYNELIYLNINEKTYTKETLNDEVIALVTALSYVSENDLYNVETYYNLSSVLGTENVTTALNKIHELGYDLIPHYQLRRMIMDMYKNKYKGLMR
jgi:hypothetical protein